VVIGLFSAIGWSHDGIVSTSTNLSEERDPKITMKPMVRRT